MGRGGDQASFKFLAVAGKFIAKLRPEPGAIQTIGHGSGARHRNVIDREQNVSGMNSGRGGGRVGGDLPGFDANRAIRPGYAVVYLLIARALHEIQPGKDDSCQRG